MPRPAALPEDSQPPPHTVHSHDLPAIFRRRLAAAGPDECWCYLGPISLGVQTRLRPHPQRNIWWHCFEFIRTSHLNLRYHHALQARLRPPLDPNDRYLPGFVCDTKYPLIELYAREELDRLTKGLWARWESEHPGYAAIPHLRCINPNHAGFQPRGHRAPSARPAPASPTPLHAPCEPQARPVRPPHILAVGVASAWLPTLSPVNLSRFQAWCREVSGHDFTPGTPEWADLLAYLASPDVDALTPEWRSTLESP